ncbi:MAG TPA: ribonuclease HII [Thermofilum sp.]|nr:ribonuclease HII [Thermofilum sp.]
MRRKFVAGIDEAGRGPVLGPMVICAIVLHETQIPVLKNLGIKDSKTLTPLQRKRLAEIIEKNAEKIVVRKVEPREIDAAVNKISVDNLNELEAKIIAEIINELPEEVEQVYVDTPDPTSEKFLARLKKYLQRKIKITAENHADRKYTIVAAASIIAKVKRDACISQLKKIYGEIGSGYPSDPKTIAFLEKWVKTWGNLPPFARKSWKTSKNILRLYKVDNRTNKLA